MLRESLRSAVPSPSSGRSGCPRCRPPFPCAGVAHSGTVTRSWGWFQKTAALHRRVERVPRYLLRELEIVSGVELHTAGHGNEPGEGCRDSTDRQNLGWPTRFERWVTRYLDD